MARERSDPRVPPLILTAELDPATQAWLDDLRARHFPPERNHLRAHLTLFHALPRRPRLPGGPVLDATVDAPFTLGRGVAFAVSCPPLLTLRAAIAAGYDDLTRQDVSWSRRPRPHVTVQNKVEPAVAAALHAELSDRYEPGPRASSAWRCGSTRAGPGRSSSALASPEARLLPMREEKMKPGRRGQGAARTSPLCIGAPGLAQARPLEPGHIRAA